MAAIEALRGPQDFIITMIEEFDKRRRYLVDEMNALEGISCVKPTGAFYVFPNTSKIYGRKFNDKGIDSSTDLSLYLLEEAKVALVHGDAFGDDNYVRLSYATSMDKIEN
jgi:aspartate aminotransferase